MLGAVYSHCMAAQLELVVNSSSKQWATLCCAASCCAVLCRRSTSGWGLWSCTSGRLSTAQQQRSSALLLVRACWWETASGPSPVACWRLLARPHPCALASLMMPAASCLTVLASGREASRAGRSRVLGGTSPPRFAVSVAVADALWLMMRRVWAWCVVHEARVCVLSVCLSRAVCRCGELLRAGHLGRAWCSTVCASKLLTRHPYGCPLLLWLRLPVLTVLLDLTRSATPLISSSLVKPP